MMSSRQIAIKNGDKSYEGRPCKKGHTRRRTKDSTCLHCKKTGTETWNQTKANKALPRDYSPTELLSMRVDRLESMIQDTMAAVCNLNERLDRKGL